MPRIRAILLRLLMSDYFILILTMIYFSGMAIFIPELRTLENTSNNLTNLWPLLVLAIGQAVVLIVAGIDLSQTAIMGLASVLGGALLTNFIEPSIFQHSPLWGVILSESGGVLDGVIGSVWIASLVMVLVGAAVGIINGSAVAFLKMPAFIVTLVTQAFFSSIAIWLVKSEKISGFPDDFLAIKEELFTFVSPMALIGIAAMLLLSIVLSRTMLGRYLYAVGTNPRASLVSGVPVNKTLISAYMFSGICAGLAGVLLSAVQESGSPTLGILMLMDVIGATVIGGVSLFGGKGKLSGVLYGVVFFIILSNTLNLMNLDSFTVLIVKGLVIVLAAGLDVLRNRIAGEMQS